MTQAKKDVNLNSLNTQADNAALQVLTPKAHALYEPIILPIV